MLMLMMMILLLLLLMLGSLKCRHSDTGGGVVSGSGTHQICDWSKLAAILQYVWYDMCVKIYLKGQVLTQNV